MLNEIILKEIKYEDKEALLERRRQSVNELIAWFFCNVTDDYIEKVTDLLKEYQQIEKSIKEG